MKKKISFTFLTVLVAVMIGVFSFGFHQFLSNRDGRIPMSSVLLAQDGRIPMSPVLLAQDGRIPMSPSLLDRDGRIPM